MAEYQQLARNDDQAPSHLSVVPPPGEFRRLSIYHEGGFAEQTGRLGELANISAGRNLNTTGKGQKQPRASQPQDRVQIHLHDPYGRATELAKALEAGEYRRLLITFPHDNTGVFIRQRLMLRSATRVMIYGDELASLYVIGRVVTTDDGRYRIQPPGENERLPHQRITPADGEVYETLKRVCKPEFRIYFNLAEYNADGVPEVVFPDGLGVYAIRTTSTHTVDEITGYLDYVRRFTGGREDPRTGRIRGGRIAGIPMQLEVVYRDVPDSTGNTHTIPIFTVTTRPPDNVRLTGRVFREIAEAGIEESDFMKLAEGAIPGVNALPAPDQDPFDESYSQIVEPDERELEMLSTGAPVNWPDFTAAWHVRTNGTALDERQPGGREQRRAFLLEWSGGELTDLEDVRRLSQADADRLIADLSAGLANQARAAQARRYDEIFAGDNEPGEARFAAPQRSRTVVIDQPATTTREPAPPRAEPRTVQPEPGAGAPPTAPPAEPAGQEARREPAEPTAAAAPAHTGPDRIRSTSALAQAFQADLHQAREMGIPPEDLRAFLVQRWPADRAEVEQKRAGLKDRMLAATGTGPPAPVAPTQVVEPAESAPVRPPASRQARESEPPPAPVQHEPEGGPAEAEREIWTGEIPPEMDLDDTEREEPNGSGGPDADAPVMF